MPEIGTKKKDNDNSDGKWSKLHLNMKSANVVLQPKKISRSQVDSKAFHIKTSIPVKQSNGSYKVAIFMYGYSKRASKSGSHEIFGIKADLMSRAFQLALHLIKYVPEYKDCLGKHKYLHQLLDCNEISPLKVENDDFNKQDIIKNGNYPHSILYGIITIDTQIEDELVAEIKAIRDCFEQTFKHSNFFEYYHQAMYWTQLGRDASFHDVLNNIKDLEEELGKEKIADAINQELGKNNFYKYFKIATDNATGHATYGNPGLNPQFFSPRGTNDSIFTLKYQLEMNVPLMKMVRQEVVRDIGYSLYGMYTPSMKVILFGYEQNCEKDGQPQHHKFNSSNFDDHYFRS